MDRPAKPRKAYAAATANKDRCVQKRPFKLQQEIPVLSQLTSSAEPARNSEGSDAIYRNRHSAPVSRYLIRII